MRFLCLVYFKPETLAALSPSAKATLNRDSLACNDELRQGNHYLVAEALEPARSARTIRVRRGKATVADGNEGGCGRLHLDRCRQNGRSSPNRCGNSIG
jgi:hypothetical protein